MNNFVKGMLFGIGIGLLVAPMRGEETRKLIADRAAELRGYIPENEQLDVYKQQISERVTQTAGTLKDYAQQAASTVKDTASSLGNQATDAASSLKARTQTAASTLQDGGKNLANTTTDAANSVKSNLN